MSEFVFGISQDQVEPAVLLDYGIIDRLTNSNLLFPYVSGALFSGRNDNEFNVSIFAQSNFSIVQLSSPFRNMETDDFAGDASTTGVVDRNGGTITGQIDFSGDSDWFAVDLAGGEILRVVNPVFNSDVGVVLRDADGNLVDSNFGPPTSLGGASFGRGIVLRADQAGTYYLDVSSSASSANYSLTTEVVTDDFADDETTLGVIPTDGTVVEGRIDFEDDTDWFAITVEANQVIRLTLNQGQIYGLRSQSPELNVYSGNDREYVFDASAAGTYFFSVTDFGSTRSLDDYNLTSVTIEDDFAANTSTTGEISLGTQVQGQINFRDDEDWFQVDLQSNQFGRFTVNHPIEDGFTQNLSLSLVDNNGDIVVFERLTFSQSGQTTSYLEIDDSLSGTYYLVVSGTGFTGENSQPTYLIESELLEDDFAGDTSTTGILTVGEDVSGAIQVSGEEDWFRLTLNGENLVELRSDPAFRMSFTLYDESGQQVILSSMGTDSGGNPIADILLDQSLVGTFYLAISGGVTDYTISAAIVEDDYLATIDTTANLIVGGEVSGAIDFRGDDDWIQIDLVEGETYRFVVDSGGLVPAQLTLYDADGGVISFGQVFRNTDFTRSRELITDIALTGTYYISVSSLDRTDYTVSVEEFDDDYSANADTTAFLGFDSFIAGSIDSRLDIDWIRVELNSDELIRFRSLDPVDIILLDETGFFVEFPSFYTNDNGQIFSEILIQGIADGVFYIQVSSSFDIVTDYSLSSEIVIDDYDNTINTVGELNLGSSIVASINYAFDEDWLGIDLIAGNNLNFRTQSDFADGLNIRIYDENGAFISGALNELPFFVNESGRYYISVSAASARDGTFELFADLVPSIEGTTGDDILLGTSAIDVINGLDGDDVIFTSSGEDRIDGGLGSDTYDVSQYEFSDSGFIIDLIQGTSATPGPEVNQDILVSIENIISGLGDDQLIAGNTGSIIFAGAGDDIITGGIGSDTLNGEDGDDSVIASAGGDTLDGGEGFDFLTYRNSDAAVTLNFLTGEFTGGYAEGDTLSNFQRISGSGFDDVIFGNGTTATLQGGFGDDTIYASELDDPEFRNFLIGGEFAFGSQLGSNLVNTGNDTLIGSAGRDVLIGLDGADFLDGGDGIDEVRYFYDRSGEGIIIDLALGTASGGNATGDTIINVENVIGSIYDDVITGDENDNVLDGFFGRDILNGGAGNDTLIGGFNGDTLTGGDGADTFDFVSSRFGYTDEITDLENADRISFGQGRGDPNGEPIDLIFIGAAEFSGRAGELRYYHEDGVTFIEYDNEGDGALNDRMRITNGEFDLFAVDNEFGSFDLRIGVVGSDSRDFLRGTAEDDFIAGGAGSDRIFGEAGNDQLFGDAGNDIIVAGDGDDSIFGGDGNDRILAGSGDDQVDGGNGDDNILGGSGDDTLSGGDGADRIEGQANNDVIDGGNGNDTLLGGNGRDLISGGLGDDVLRGEDGNDLIEGNAGDDFLGGGAGNDLLIGGRGADRLYGGSGEDRLFGQQGNDLLFGGGGNDRLIGGGGNDSLNGQSGNDILDGGSSNDILTGGGGADIFIFNASAATTIVTDFTDGVDLLDLSDFSDADIQSALDSAVQQDGDSVLTFSNGAVLVLEGFDLSDLSDEDILGFDGVDMMAAIA